VTAADHFVILIVTVITGLGVIMGGLVFIFRLLWNIRGAWDETNRRLALTNIELRHLLNDSKETKRRLNGLERRERERREGH
jgi:hypothetical protein